MGLIKPLQRVVVGSHLSGTSVDGAEMAATGLWRSLGLALGLLGGVFAVVDLLAQGAVLRASAEKKCVFLFSASASAREPSPGVSPRVPQSCMQADADVRRIDRLTIAGDARTTLMIQL